MNTASAVAALRPDLTDADYRVEDHGNGQVLVWLRPDIPQPSQDDLRRGWEMHQANAYRIHRADAYPSIGDQLDAVWKGMIALRDAGIELPADTLGWLDEVAAVKDQYPKP